MLLSHLSKSLICQCGAQLCTLWPCPQHAIIPKYSASTSVRNAQCVQCKLCIMSSQTQTIPAICACVGLSTRVRWGVRMSLDCGESMAEVEQRDKHGSGPNAVSMSVQVRSLQQQIVQVEKLRPELEQREVQRLELEEELHGLKAEQKAWRQREQVYRQQKKQMEDLQALNERLRAQVLDSANVPQELKHEVWMLCACNPADFQFLDCTSIGRPEHWSVQRPAVSWLCVACP